MLRILNCIQRDHDWSLVLLAGLLCVASCVAAVLLLHRAQEGSRADQRRWLGVAGFATGFGIWATHFVAMLAYKSDLIAGYA
ncbi:MAG: hypothetical protein JWM75_2740 [Sphingomonas bacterium]|nr:hypothetical protein [Sphingomonas bacterium]